VTTLLPRHVLHVLNSAGGGAALSTIGLMESLRQRGIESSAVCHDSGSASEREQLNVATGGKLLFTPLYWWNYKIRQKTWKRPLSELRQLWRTGWKRRSTAQVVQFAQRHAIDLIHSNTILTLEGGFAGRQLGLPHVWHVRELVGPGHPFRLPREGPALGRFLQSQAAKVIANSQATAAAIQSWLPPGLLDVVPNGIDVSRFVPRRHDAEKRPLVVAMVGSLTSRWKNHRLFIQAAGLVDPALPIEWRIYGHDPSLGGQLDQDDYVNQLLAEVQRAGLADRFRLAGFHSDPAEIMAQVDLLVHPAESESFGRVIVEGMAAGLPVVGVNAGGVGEIVRHEETGLLAPPGAADVMARYITQLVCDAELRGRYGAAGCRRAHECYSLQACVEGVIRTYRAAMAASASGSAAQSSAASGRTDAAALADKPVSVSG
jgi:glycosyltransferase involved in cell wall biosynthesis